jgi:hypothetical protein
MNRKNNNKLFNYAAIILLGVTLGFYICFFQYNKCLNVVTGNLLEFHKNYLSLGEEFRLFYTASYMVANGKLSDLYNNSRFAEVEDSLTNPNGHHMWLYPPTFVLMILPLSLLPYLASLTVWLSITLGGYLLVLRRICPLSPIYFWILLFPGIVFNTVVGHNGCLSGIILGLGLLCLESSPLPAAIFFGMMFFKPQLAFLILLVLVAGRYWKVLGMTVAVAVGMGIISLLILGDNSWLGFFHNLFNGAELTDIPFFWKKMPTVYATARLAEGGIKLAWILQGLTMAGVLCGVSWVWFREASAACRASILVIGILLFTNYAFIYDYAILAIPLAWLWQEGESRGWLSLEKPLLLVAWVMPLIALMTGFLLWLPMILTLMALFILVLRRHVYELGRARGALVAAMP